MGAAQDLPEVESLASLARDERAPLIPIQVPLADIGGFVTGPLVHFREGDRLAPEPHIVQEDAMSQRILAGQQTGAIWTADRAARYGVLEVDAFFDQAIQVRRAYIVVAGVAGRFRPPLVGENKNHVRFLPRHRCLTSPPAQHERCGAKAGCFQQISSFHDLHRH